MDRPNNRDVVTYAVAILGGDSEYVHTEDVAIKCHELAPDAFSWTKYPQYPDLEVARRTLLNARSEEFGALVEGRSGQGPRKRESRSSDGWRLTDAGQRWVKSNGAALEIALSNSELSDRRQHVRRQLRRVYDHSTYQTFVAAPGDFSATRGELAELLRVRVDAPQDVWDGRFEELRAKAVTVEDDELIEFVARCRVAQRVGR